MLTVEALPTTPLDRAAQQRRFRFAREDGVAVLRCVTRETMADPVSLRQWVGEAIQVLRTG